jgi:tungstate transport system substrate-binding protein
MNDYTKRFFQFTALCALVATVVIAMAGAPLILATTTSTVDSGLLDALIPVFEQQTGITVKTIGVGSGMAIKMGQQGNADVLLVHSPADEEKLMKEGSGMNRQAVMHNDFILCGSSEDPAKVRNATTITEAFRRIARAQSLFISRGDRSGTHVKELSLWPATAETLSNLWYLESGQGMGATLTIANQKKAYTLADRATFLAFHDKLKLVVLSEGDARLMNPYHVIEVNPAKHPKVNAVAARAFSEFMVAPETQKMIADFGKAKFGQSLFFPDANPNL